MDVDTHSGHENLQAGNLEGAINSAKKSTGAKDENGIPEMSSEQEIGFHKGALNTLVAERTELVKMIGNVEAIIQAHIKRLKELGVDIK